MPTDLTKFLAIQAVSLGGVAILITLAWLLGFRARTKIVDEAQVLALTQAANLRLPNAVAIDVDGRVALAEIDSNTVFVVKAMGDKLTTRVFPRIAVADIRMYRPKGKGIGARFRFSDAGFDDFRIEFAEREAPAFIERLRRGAKLK